MTANASDEDNGRTPAAAPAESFWLDYRAPDSAQWEPEWVVTHRGQAHRFGSLREATAFIEERCTLQSLMDRRRAVWARECRLVADCLDAVEGDPPDVILDEAHALRGRLSTIIAEIERLDAAGA